MTAATVATGGHRAIAGDRRNDHRGLGGRGELKAAGWRRRTAAAGVRGRFTARDVAERAIKQLRRVVCDEVARQRGRDRIPLAIDVERDAPARATQRRNLRPARAVVRQHLWRWRVT